MGEIVIITATDSEQGPLRDFVADTRVRWVVSGMGATAAAYGTMKAIYTARERPDLMILAGIAGAFPGNELQVGDVVLVQREYQADIGAWRGETGEVELFTEREEMRRLECPYMKGLGLENLFPTVGSRSANIGCSSLPLRQGEAIENMEGAAFFEVCLKEKVPFLELRAVSNRITDRREDWRIGEALRALGEGVMKVLDRYAAKG